MLLGSVPLPSTPLGLLSGMSLGVAQTIEGNDGSDMPNSFRARTWNVLFVHGDSGTCVCGSIP
jgi:hypothetical protein